MNRIARRSTGLLSPLPIVFAPLVLSCGGGLGNGVRPNDYKVTDALGAEAPTCKGEPAFARPLTVDLDADTRSDLEASMKQGVVVVSYDCAHLRVLSNCAPPNGGYKYVRVDLKEDLVQLKGMDELKGNLTFGVAKLGAEVKAGRSIDVALVRIGIQSTTVGGLQKGELRGQCDSATHYIQKAFLGAFSMSAGSGGKVSSAAELFSYGVSGSSSSERNSSQRDGSLEACRKADAEAKAPTPECKTALRVELTPLTGDAATGRESKEVMVEANPCRKGYKFVDGRCTNDLAHTSNGYLCDPSNESECRAECEKGNAGSCTNVGSLIMRRAYKITLERAEEESRPFFKKSCDAGDQAGCAGYFRATFPDEKKAASKMALVNELFPIGKKACDAGVPMACHDLGTFTSPIVYVGMKFADAETSRKYFARGCNLGYEYSCVIAATEYFKVDMKMAIALYTRGCDAGNGFVCNQLAARLISGRDDVPKDVPRGIALAEHACEISIEDCDYSAELLRDAGKSEEAVERATRGCQDKDTRTGLDEGDRGRAQLQRAHACYVLGKLYTDGAGPDPAKAKKAFSSACANGDTRGCGK